MEERREHCIAHMEKTETLLKTVFGNGRPGLAYDMVSVKITTKIILGLQLATISAIIKILISGA